MRRLLVVMLLLLPVLSFAQLPADSMSEKSDTINVKKFKAADIVGASLIGVGTVGLLGTKITYDILEATVGRVSTADFYIFGGLAVAGLGTILTSRIIARNSKVKPTIGTVSIPEGQKTVSTIGVKIDL